MLQFKVIHEVCRCTITYLLARMTTADYISFGNRARLNYLVSKRQKADKGITK